MPVVCELRPCQDATPEQFKELGEALKAWASRELGNGGVLCSIDPEGLASLLSGEPPNPLALQLKKHNEEVSLEKIRQDLGSLASDRSLCFTVKDEPRWPRAMVIENVRQAIPAELVEDILIDGESWTE
jgi:hypothetical protein